MEKGTTIKIDEHCFVRLLDWMGSDVSIVDSVWLGRVREKPGSDDGKRIRQLLSLDDTSPFRAVFLKFHLRMTLASYREFLRLPVTQTIVDLSDDYQVKLGEVHLPEELQKENPESQSPPLEQKLLLGRLNTAYKFTENIHSQLVSAGVDLRQASLARPAGQLMEFTTVWNLWDLMRFHTESEFTFSMMKFAFDLFPETIAAWKEQKQKETSLSERIHAAIMAKVGKMSGDEASLDSIIPTVDELSEIISS